MQPGQAKEKRALQRQIRYLLGKRRRLSCGGTPILTAPMQPPVFRAVLAAAAGLLCLPSLIGAQPTSPSL